ncbi:LacI family transcriptional regulator [bacterium]|nr:MAG: LacI family transcriptional regulator [bacterium]
MSIEHDNRTSAQHLARPTLIDVARAAGVSIATVSYALNGRPGVGAETRRRVLELAAALGFRPNRLARGLRSGRAHVLGLLISDVANPTYTEIASAVVNEAAAIGYHVFLSHEGVHGELKRQQAEALLDQRCAGLIFTSVVEGDRPLLARIRASGVPVVQVIRKIDGVGADFIGTDEEAAGYRAAAHLLALGHRCIAMAAGPRVSSASRLRAAGVRRALAAAGLAIPAPWYSEGDLNVESGYALCAQMLSQGPPPTALVCGNDVMALGSMDAIIDAGLRIPGDVAVVGFDDMALASSRLIELTTVRSPHAEIGRRAVQRLLERIERPELPAREILLEEHLIVRRSSGGQRAAAQAAIG